MARIFKTDGNVQEVTPWNGTNFTLEELQTIVEGGIEVIHLYAGELMVINEDNKKTGFPVNYAATYLYVKGTGCSDKIHGDVLICKESEVQ